jgi:hypothetical protein
LKEFLKNNNMEGWDLVSNAKGRIEEINFQQAQIEDSIIAINHFSEAEKVLKRLHSSNLNSFKKIK